MPPREKKTYVHNRILVSIVGIKYSASLRSAPPHKINGLHLVENLLTVAEQAFLVDWVQSQLHLGRQGLLTGSTFTPVPKEYDERHQSREMLQYGTYTHSNKIQNEEVGALAPELVFVVDRLV